MPAQQMASDTAPLVSAAEIRSCVQSLLERVSLDSLTLRDVRRELRDQLGAKAGEHYQKPWLKELVGELVMRERAGAEGRAEESTGESGERGQRGCSEPSRATRLSPMTSHFWSSCDLSLLLRLRRRVGRVGSCYTSWSACRTSPC